MFEWKIFSGHTPQQLFQETLKLMEIDLWVQPKNFEDRTIFLSMYNDIDWTAKDNASICDQKSSEVSEYSAKFPRGSLDFLMSWKRNMVRDVRIQTRRGLESNSMKNDAELRGERAPSVQGNQSINKRSIEKCGN